MDYIFAQSHTEFSKKSILRLCERDGVGSRMTRLSSSCCPFHPAVPNSTNSVNAASTCPPSNNGPNFGLIPELTPFLTTSGSARDIPFSHLRSLFTASYVKHCGTCAIGYALLAPSKPSSIGQLSGILISTLPEGKQLNIAKTDVRIQTPQTAWIYVYSRGRQKRVTRRVLTIMRRIVTNFYHRFSYRGDTN